MKPVSLLILGSCLLMQSVSSQQGRMLSASLDSQLNSIPLYHHKQARELLGLTKNARIASDNEIIDRSLELALYIHRRTQRFLPITWQPEAKAVAEAFIYNANLHEMDPLFLMSIVKQESRFNPNAIGQHGEIGLMQIKPSTALWLIEQDAMPEYEGESNLDALRIALMNPTTNIAFGSAYLAHLRSAFRGRGPLYISAYNMGAMNLKSKLKSGKRPRIYSDQILAVYTEFSLDFHRSPQLPRVKTASLPRTFDLH